MSVEAVRKRSEYSETKMKKEVYDNPFFRNLTATSVY
jgi:hypothetical protein